MQNLDRVRYITRHYPVLKGLKMVPFGLFMLVMAFRNLGWTGLGREGDCTYTLPLLLVMIILVYAADRYYTRSFGTVEHEPKLSGWLSGTAVLGVLVSAIVLEVAIRPPVSLIGMAVGALFVFDGISTRRIYYSLCGAALVIVSLLPLFLQVQLPSRLFGSFGFLINAAMGLVLIITGLIDHWMLVRTLKPIAGGE